MQPNLKTYGDVINFLEKEGVEGIAYLPTLELRNLVAGAWLTLPIKASISLHNQTINYTTSNRYNPIHGLSIQWDNVADWIKKDFEILTSHEVLRDQNIYLTGSCLGWWVHPSESLEVTKEKRFVRSFMYKSNKSDIDLFIPGMSNSEANKLVKIASKETGIKANNINWWGIAIPTSKSENQKVIPANSNGRCSAEWNQIYSIIKENQK